MQRQADFNRSAVSQSEATAHEAIVRGTAAPRARARLLRRGLLGTAAFGLAALGLSACGTPPGSFDVQDSSQTKWANLQAMVQFKAPPRQPTPVDHVKCPDIAILDGTAEDRVYGTGDQTNANLRHQFSMTQVARDCQVDGGTLKLKIGVAGKLLLGPVGAPGTFPAPIRIAIVRDNDQQPIASKLYQQPVTVAAGATEAPFALVVEDMSVPYSNANAQHDYTIKVGFDSGPNRKQKAIPEAAGPGHQDRDVATSSNDPQPQQHHRRHQAPAGSGD